LQYQFLNDVPKVSVPDVILKVLKHGIFMLVVYLIWWTTWHLSDSVLGDIRKELEKMLPS
jgi:hypothetical protein